jgi:glycosyltransferase involved in cell wall biosynthesis
MDKPLISILITNYNTVEFVKLSLFAIEKLTYNSYQVLVNDNGSNENNITELKNLENNKEYLKVNYRQSKYKETSFAHAEALDILIDMVDTKYFVVLDSDCVLLLKNWDQYCISELNETVKIIGTQIASLKGTGHKPDDFPFQFAVFCETETYKKLNISCMPENTTTKDTCWEWKPKYLDAGYTSKLFYAKNTKEYQDGPFKTVYCAEYYTDDNKLICNHFGRGSSGGTAKYNNKWWFNIPLLSRFIRKYIGLQEKKEWISICKSIINRQVDK